MRYNRLRKITIYSIIITPIIVFVRNTKKENFCTSFQFRKAEAHEQRSLAAIREVVPFLPIKRVMRKLVEQLNEATL